MLAQLVAAASLAGLAAYNHVRARQAALRALRGRMLDVGPARLHVLDEGVGMPLVLLHGNGSAAEDFVAGGLVARASGHYRVLAVDRPGFGASSRPRGTVWTAAEQADLIDSALRQLGVERYLVLGHSLGATVALECGRRHPGSVAGVIAVSGCYFPAPPPVLALASLPALPVLGTLARYTLLPPLARMAWPATMERLFGPAPVPPSFSTAMLDLSSGPETLRSIAAETALLVATAGEPPDYRGMSVPVGIIAGASDALFDAAAQARQLQAEIPSAHLEIIQGAGHMVHQTAPDAMMAMIDRIAAERRPG